METLKKKAVVVHSGGMDSSICLAIACDKFGAENVLSLSFSYGQRHAEELKRAKIISDHFKVDHLVLDINCLQKITTNALMDKNQEMKIDEGVPNTLVVGRNGLMARLAAIHAESLGANCIFMGIIEVEEANSGYRDCSRKYMDIIEEALRLDFGNDTFKILTPLVKMTKKETLEVAHKLNVLEYLLEETITCYNGKAKFGCGKCPSCLLRNQGLYEFTLENPDVNYSYMRAILTKLSI